MNISHDRLLHELLPYRTQAVDTLNLAIRMRMKWAESPPMSIYIYGKLSVDGNLNAFTNPAIEAGLVHCRALLEFLGLRMTDAPRLDNVKKRRRTDIGIEHFRNTSGPLRKVMPDDALNRYAGGREEAEKALLAVFQITNKGLVHFTEEVIGIQLPTPTKRSITDSLSAVGEGIFRPVDSVTREGVCAGELNAARGASFGHCGGRQPKKRQRYPTQIRGFRSLFDCLHM